MESMTRRQLFRWAGAGAATLVLSAHGLADEEKKEDKKDGHTYPFTLPKLPYAFDALEPHIDARTMEIHHDRHHKAYVDGLNAALKGHEDLQKKTLHELIAGLAHLPKTVQTAVRNMGGGHLNHSLFWVMMAKGGGGEPKGELAKGIDSAFGSFDKFKDAFSKAGATRFGSGWAWLASVKGKLLVTSTANQDNPLTHGGVPLLGLDVWEHAYYLKYQNMRPAYIKAWWNVVNWDDVAHRFSQASK